MKLRLNIDTTNLEKRLRKNQNQYMRLILRDAIEYLCEKIKSEVISGQYVGVRTGNLRANTHVESTNEYIRIKSDMFYTEHVVEWSKKRYGRSYVEIVLDLYGASVKDTIAKEAKKFYRKDYVYSNPFV